VGPLLREAAAVRHVECATAIEAAVLELRLIQRFLPRYNRASTQWPKYAYVRVGGTAARPRAATTADPAAKPGEAVLGPIPSRRIARDVVAALQTAASLLDGDAPPAPLVAHDPRPLLRPLAARMRALADDERFEDAAVVRDLAGALARAVDQQRRTDALRRAGRMRLRWRGIVLHVEHGRLCVDVDPRVLAGLRGTAAAASVAVSQGAADEPAAGGPLPRWLVDEVVCLATWLERQASHVRVEHADAGWAGPSIRLPRFAAVERPGARALPDPPQRRNAIATRMPLRRGTAPVP
jgi:DNA polymerase-3 subunit epsilon